MLPVCRPKIPDLPAPSPLNFKKFKYIILFLGKTGKEILNEATKKWNFDYEEKKSLTSEGSLVIKISNLKKKNG